MENWLNEQVICARKPSRKEKLTLRFLIICGVISAIIFLAWFFSEDRNGYAPLYWPLTFILIYKLYRIFHEWYHYFSISVPAKPQSEKLWKVDILTTFCKGEPYPMIENTLRAMQNIRYPHTSYLCDEADDPYLKNLCAELGIRHVTRKEKINAKAGNINNALRQAEGELCIVLDPDHVPHPEFIERVVPYFEDPGIGYVQIVQAYKNHRESLISLAAAEQTYHFYGPMMMTMNSYGTAQAIGANCTFRRSALDSIGGHAAGLAEDMHTAMQLHAKGWKSVYVPEVLTKGLVPVTFSGFASQQLKWSRGCFDLLFYVLPGIFRKLTWRQKIHYTTGPLYFLNGISDFANLLLPVLSLFLSEFPWRADILEFACALVPVLIFSILIRQYSQRWLLEKHEKGLSIFGGFLRIGVWWIYCIGFLYTVLKIKVPYIPTPKDDKPANEWKICLPNIALIIISLFAVIYGLKADWNPYSIVMAAFASVNILILTGSVLMAQHIFLNWLKSITSGNELRVRITRPARIIFYNLRFGFYALIRNSALLLGTATFCTMLYLLLTINDTNVSGSDYRLSGTGKFYTGIAAGGYPDFVSLNTLGKLELEISSKFSIVNVSRSFDTTADQSLPSEIIRIMYSRDSYTMLNWNVASGDSSKKENVYENIIHGRFDNYIRSTAEAIAALNIPVFINFAPRFNEHTAKQGCTENLRPQDFITAWKHVHNLFQESGASHVAWVWNPVSAENMRQYFPGEIYVNWICMNYSEGIKEGKRSMINFDQAYTVFNKRLKPASLRKEIPVMVINTLPASSEFRNIHRLYERIYLKYPEIHSVVYSFELPDIAVLHSGPGTNIREWKTRDSVFICRETDSCRKNSVTAPSGKSKKGCRNIFRNKDGFVWKVDGKPFMIRGVEYNDDNILVPSGMSRTRGIIEKDFREIKAMHANTISIWRKNSFDVNVLNIADEYNLKVIYKFWFDPSVDYLKDTLRIKKMARETLQAVKNLKQYNSVICWVAGGPVWNDLENHFRQPYLTEVRKAYLRFAEQLIAEIHKVDPERPVTLMTNCSSQLNSVIRDFHNQAPSADMIAFNGFDDDEMRKVYSVMKSKDPERPYFWSSFGARSYKHYSFLNNNQDETDFSRGERYFLQWGRFAELRKDVAAGGVASCWRDNNDGTSAMYGITDFTGRKKAGYYSLMNVWSGKAHGPQFPRINITCEDTVFVRNGIYDFTLSSTDRLAQFTQVEWFLGKADDFRNTEAAGTEDGIFELELQMPSSPGNYRLYTFLSDDLGNVVTASKAIYIKGKKGK
jgi:cellulose synthase (UDP-forming)